MVKKYWLEMCQRVYQNLYIILFLLNCALVIFVIEKRVNCGGGYGLEITSSFNFYGPIKAITWIRKV